MKTTEQWHNDPEFWNTFSPAMFSKTSWEMVPFEIDNILKLLNLSPGAKVLDLCCGPGRHSLELARRGFKVTGVDKTISLLNSAKTRASNENLDIEFVHQDMRLFQRKDTFEGAVNLFTAFGYFENESENKQVLSNLYHSLKPGGRLVLDILGKEVLAAIFKPQDWRQLEDGSLQLEERKILNDWSIVESRWIRIHNNQQKEFKVTLRLYSANELSVLMKEAGFSKVNIFGDLSGIPYDNQAKRLIAVAYKE